MNNPGQYLDQLLFNALPYMAVFTFFLMTIRRYRARTFTYSSLSSQFLENQQHFWGMVPFALLMLEVIVGVAVALLHPWGSSWFAATAVPYFWSLLKLNPDISYVTPMPWLVKVHIINAYLLILLFPFTRLVHILVVPNPYLWRKPQVVRWYRKPART